MFPFIIPAVEAPHFTQNPYEFGDAFCKAKPADLSWFAYDVVVK